MELNGDDIRHDPLEVRKATTRIYRGQGPSRHPRIYGVQGALTQEVGPAAPSHLSCVCPLSQNTTPTCGSSCRERHGRRFHVANERANLNTSTVANGSADHGRKPFNVNFVFCPGRTSTRR